MTDREELLRNLQRQVRVLEDDLREQVEVLGELRWRLEAEYDRAFKLGRTAATWAVWRDDRVTQAAVAWVLGTVFVRFCEDNGLLPSPYLAGPSAERMTLAEEAQEQFFRVHPSETDRGWLLAAFDAIRAVPVGAFLFDERHNPLYQIPTSHDAAKTLISFWRRHGEDGRLVHDFTDDAWDTRFLGELYQDLSKSAQKTYALLQTPEFVEEFILDHTLTPAIEEFGYDKVKLIDPTCGSGHFLLGAFHRLLAEWERNSPGRDGHERIRLALQAIHGVDVNPFAVAIARFRLLVAALRVAGFAALTEAAGYSFPLNIAVGDSLIKARQLSLFADERDELAEFAYATEDIHEHPSILQQGRYHVVVGNPPYITVRDKRLNSLYRGLYQSCHREYSLSIPFIERFFDLARPEDANGQSSGYIGQITANSFMKREFGKRLIEDFLPTIDLSHIIDTSGAHIPGHGTDTVILLGRRRIRNRGTHIRTVFGIRREPGIPEDPRKGVVWQSIIDQIERPGSESDWVSVEDMPRDRFASHPWSTSGGGGAELTDLLQEICGKQLRDTAKEIGFAAITGEDDAFSLAENYAKSTRVENTISTIPGAALRDWEVLFVQPTISPYSLTWRLLAENELSRTARFLWPSRTSLYARKLFGISILDRRDVWYKWRELYPNKLRTPFSIAYGEIATHTHFILGREGEVFNQTSPIVKLHQDSTEDEHLGLLAVLNSSTACFWFRQVCQPKGGSGIGRGVQDEGWEQRYQFNVTNISQFPLPTSYPFRIAQALDHNAQSIAQMIPSIASAHSMPSHECLDELRRKWEYTRARMVTLQEELDWQVYSLYGLLDDEITAPAESLPELRLGERAFEIVLARKIAAYEVETQWFARHGSTPITEVPAHWPAEYRAIVEKRIAVIESNRNIALIERPECKRRWVTEGWDAMQAKALRGWLLDRCEGRELWFHHVDGTEQPRPLTTSQLADELRRDPDFVAVAELYAPGKDPAQVVAELIADEHVPYLAALRYNDAGLGKRADWEYVWDLQRQEDAAAAEEEKRKVRDTIPVPPKYGSGDFLRTSYWRNRGKLDVPKERFVSYPHASRDGDSALLLGWAGWDHREQAQALATLVVEREQTDGWDAERLTPLLAGLREVLPWVHQWHGEFDPAYGGSPAEVYAGFLADQQNRLRLTDEALARWRPPKATRGRKKATGVRSRQPASSESSS